MNWNILKRKAQSIVNPLIGVTVTHFTTHGCQAQIHEFDWVGIIVSVNHNFGDWYFNKTAYKVQILKDKTGWEQRDYPDEKKYHEVPSWYLQNLGGTYVAYD